jgi:hypothetical protein
MAWPDSLATLLALGPSPVSQALRWGLCGLRAELQSALAETPNAPGAEELRRLLPELDALLDRSAGADPVLPSDNGTDRPGPAKAEVFPGASGLLVLAGRLAEDPRLGAILQAAPIRDGSDDDTWNAIQRILLRIPAPLAADWQQRCLQFAQENGARPDESRTAVVPLLRDEVIYPGLSGTSQACGLGSTATAALDPRVRSAPDNGLNFLAGVVATCLWFIEHDPNICHCLKNVVRFGITPLQDGQRERYRDELLRLWERLRTGLAESPLLGKEGPGRVAPRQWFRERLKEHLDLDEAIHSLVYRPPAAPDSWWGRLQGQARDTLFQTRDRAIQAGCPVHLQVLGGSFAEINRLAPDSIQVDFGVPGEVAACLRVWARIDGEEIKGRVLYRSPQEEL